MMTTVTGSYQQLSAKYRAQLQQRQVIALSEGLEQYFREKNGFPATLATLPATPGFEYTASSIVAWEGYAVSPAIVDSTWTFNRAVLYMVDPTKYSSGATYLASNACGTGGYDTAQSWCGSSSSMWYRKETREGYSLQVNTQRARFNRMNQKLANYFNKYQRFPNLDNLNNALGANSVTPLTTLAGYAGTASNCSGVYQYQGIPINCEDMYDIWGGQIGYQFIGNLEVILTSESPILNNSGNRVVIAGDNTAP